MTLEEEVQDLRECNKRQGETIQELMRDKLILEEERDFLRCAVLRMADSGIRAQFPPEKLTRSA